MSILNVNQIQPVGSGQTVTISAANITASSSTISASSFVGGVTVTSGNLTGISSVSTTNLTVNGNAYPATGPLSNRNLIINGAMQVAQRGTSSTSSGYQTVDRWINQFSGGAVTQSQQSLSSGDPYNEGFRHFLRLTNTTSSTASNSYRDIATRIEAQNVTQSGWQYTSSTSYITVSFWARSSVAQTYYLNLQSEDGTKQTYPASFALSADTWTKVTKTIPGNSSITINNDNGLGMYVTIIPFYGTDYTDSGVTDNAWNARATGTQLPDMTNTWSGTTNATFDVTGVQLEVGEVATPFEHRSYGDELARCQRYYYRHADGSWDPHHAIGTGMWYSTTDVYGAVHFPVAMRSVPTLQYTAASTTAFQCFAAGAGSTTDDWATQEQGRTCFIWNLYNLSPARTAGQGAWAQLNNSSGSHLSFTAEL